MEKPWDKLPWAKEMIEERLPWFRDQLETKLPPLVDAACVRVQKVPCVGVPMLKKTLAEREEQIARLEDTRRQQDAWHDEMTANLDVLKKMVDEAQEIRSKQRQQELERQQREAAEAAAEQERQQAELQAALEAQRAREVEQAASTIQGAARHRSSVLLEKQMAEQLQAELERLAAEFTADRQEHRRRFEAAVVIQAAARGRVRRRVMRSWFSTLTAAMQRRGNIAENMRERQRAAEQVRSHMSSFSPRRTSSRDGATAPAASSQEEAAEAAARGAAAARQQPPEDRPKHVPSAATAIGQSRRRSMDEVLQLASDEEVRVRKQAASRVETALPSPPMAAAAEPPPVPQEEQLQEVPPQQQLWQAGEKEKEEEEKPKEQAPQGQREPLQQPQQPRELGKAAAADDDDAASSASSEDSDFVHEFTELPLGGEGDSPPLLQGFVRLAKLYGSETLPPSHFELQRERRLLLLTEAAIWHTEDSEDGETLGRIDLLKLKSCELTSADLDDGVPGGELVLVLASEGKCHILSADPEHAVSLADWQAKVRDAIIVANRNYLQRQSG